MRASFFATRSFTGCMHSNRLPGSKYMHCLHECNSNPHFGHFPSTPNPCRTVPHCAQRETSRVPGKFTGRGPSAWSHFGGPLLRSGGVFRGASFFDSCSLSRYPGCRYFPTDSSQARAIVSPPCQPGQVFRIFKSVNHRGPGGHEGNATIGPSCSFVHLCGIRAGLLPQQSLDTINL